METNEIVSLVHRAENIKRVTANLVEKSSEFAQYVARSMTDAGASSLLKGRLILTDHASNVGRYDTLEYLYDCTAKDRYCYDADVSGNLLEDSMGDGHYVHGDFHSWVNCPDREDIVTFLGLSVEILTELASFGTEDEVEKK